MKNPARIWLASMTANARNLFYLPALPPYQSTYRPTNIRLVKYWFHFLFAPYLLPGLFWIFPEIVVPFVKVPVDGSRAFLHRRIIAVMDHRFGHAAKHRLDHVQVRCFPGQRY